MSAYLTQLLHRHRQGRPDRLALVCGDVRRNYRDVASRVECLAAGLQGLGAGPGDRIAVLSPNSVEYVEALFAAWWIGAVVVPLNTRWSEPEIALALRDCTPRLLLAEVGHLAVASRLRAEDAAPSGLALLGAGMSDGILSCERWIEDGARVEDRRQAGGTLAALLYTGGTTGRSKGVMLSHDNLCAAALCRLADAQRLDDSVCLLTTPLFHVAGVVRSLTHLTAGGTTVVMPQFRAAEALALINRERVTDAQFVPSMLQMLLDDPAYSPGRLRSVRRIGYGAAPSAQALLERTQREMPWVGLVQQYGMTESCAVGTTSQPTDHDDAAWSSGRARSAGRACAGIELRLVGENEQDAASGAAGEILLRGPTVMSGYWNRPDETSRVLRDGWLHTGDAGRLDAEGCLHVVDRLKDMIVTGGENVYSAEVENALAQHPAVAQCAVIGVPHALWGEAVHAVVVLRPGHECDEPTLQAHCRQLLANYKCPKRVSFRGELPMTAAGKVAKHRLRSTD